MHRGSCEHVQEMAVSLDDSLGQDGRVYLEAMVVGAFERPPSVGKVVVMAVAQASPHTRG